MLEKDELAAIEYICSLLNSLNIVSAVRITVTLPISWTDWCKEGGGHTRYNQPRNLGSAVLHISPEGERVLFVLNHYPDAADFELTFRDITSELECLDTGRKYTVINNKVILDIDRKSACIYAVR